MRDKGLGIMVVLNRHENPVLRHSRYFDFATAQMQHEAMHIQIKINAFCSRDLGFCS